MSVQTMQRPGTVTTVVVLTWFAAIIDVVAGVVLFFLARDDEVLRILQSTTQTVRVIAITSIVIGVLAALVAVRLGQGGRGARMLVTLLMVIRIAAGVWAIASVGSHALTESIITIVLSVIVLMLLWNARASTFFAAR